MISVHALSYSVSGRDLLFDLTLSFNEGEICTLIGPPGAGKTLLLGILAGAGKKPGASVISSSISLEPDNTTFLPGTIDINQADTVANIVLAARTPFKKLTDPLSSLDKELATGNMRLFGLDEYADSRLELLPDSLYKKTWLAHAFTRDTDVLLLDNPDEGLDPGSVISLERAIVRYASQGRIVICATHDLNFAARISEKIIVMKNGKIFAQGASGILNEDLIRSAFGIETIVTKNVYNGRPEVSFVPQS